MEISKGNLLTYCTNIHPGEKLQDVMQYLADHTLAIKERISPDQPFGIGLRLSSVASKELLEGYNLAKFKQWLSGNGLYVFTINGFPYGEFHQQAVKDQVHQPDWSTPERLDYTIRLIHILEELLPENVTGSISTSPLTYKPWFYHDKSALDEHIQAATVHVAMAAGEMCRIKLERGINIHLDIEPEPDGYLENTQEVVDYFNQHLLVLGAQILQKKYHISPAVAKSVILEHIQVCYDVCHFALAYENPAYVFDAFEEAGLKIGKIQISAALKATFKNTNSDREKIGLAIQAFNEPTYLHQVVAKKNNGNLQQYHDIPEALPHIMQEDVEEWRIHFHVPVFLANYAQLGSTQQDILAVFEELKKREAHHHLEIETYTWDVLPLDLQVSVDESIVREFDWVMEKLRIETPA